MRMDFAYASDKSYLPIVSVSLLSLLSHHMGKEIYVHFLADGINEQQKRKLLDICERFDATIIFYDIEQSLAKMKEEGFEGFGINCNYTSYARVLLPDILNEKVKKVLYLDCDTMIMGNLDELFEMDFGQNIVAGVKDIVPSFYREQIGMKNTLQYINSGVLLFNIEKWVSNNCTEKMKKFINKNKSFIYPDQDYINLVVGSKRIILPQQYNVLSQIVEWKPYQIRKMFMMDLEDWYSDMEVKNGIKNVKIVHLVDSFLGRPWQAGNQSYFKEYWHEQLKLSPFENELEVKYNVSKRHILLLKLYGTPLKKLVSVIYTLRVRNRIKERHNNKK